MQKNIAVSIIVPLAADECLWREMFAGVLLPPQWEVLFAAATPPPDDWQNPPQQKWLHHSQSGRARQMNAAAQESRGEFLWFVHADSRLPADAAQKLLRSLHLQPRALHYFSLSFYDGGWKMKLNEIGVRIRCAVFNNPFGDQTLCLSRRLFMQLDGFPETEGPGEDHLFVLHALRRGIKIRRVNAAVATSARRYVEQGWWNTVRRFQRIWWRQWRS